MPASHAMKGQWELPRFREMFKLQSGQDIYCLRFYPYAKPGVDPIFAFVGGPNIMVCRTPTRDQTFEPILSIIDLEKIKLAEELRLNDRKKEKEEKLVSVDHWAIAWSKDSTGTPLLCVAGNNCKILVVNALTGELLRTLAGHGGVIECLETCPTNPELIASTSEDTTIRIWSLNPQLESNPCVAILDGDGHKDRIPSLAWHSTGRFLLSGGVDRRICLWAVPDFSITNANATKTTYIFYPHFSCNQLHDTYIDCVAFHGDLILSKCDEENIITLWMIDGFSSSLPFPDQSSAPTIHDENSTASAFSDTQMKYTRLLDFHIPEGCVHWARFALFPGSEPKSNSDGNEFHSSGPILAFGNSIGQVMFWDFNRIEAYGTWLAAHDLDSTVPPPPFLTPIKPRAGKILSTNDVVELSKKEWNKQYYAHSPHYAELEAHAVGQVMEMDTKGRQWPFSSTARSISWSKGGEWCVIGASGGSISIWERWDGEVVLRKDKNKEILAK